MKRSIYLATPYWHEDKGIRLSRYRIVTDMAGKLMQMGYIVFSPITHSHPISLTIEDKQDHDFWLEQDYYWLDRCDELWVLQLPGWEESYGVGEEHKRAYNKGLRIRYCTEQSINNLWKGDFI